MQTRFSRTFPRPRSCSSNNNSFSFLGCNIYTPQQDRLLLCPKLEIPSCLQQPQVVLKAARTSLLRAAAWFKWCLLYMQLPLVDTDISLTLRCCSHLEPGSGGQSGIDYLLCADLTRRDALFFSLIEENQCRLQTSRLSFLVNTRSLGNLW